MNQQVLVAVASGSEDLIPTLVENLRRLRPDLPLLVISEFQVENAQWIPYHLGRTLEQNLALARSVIAGRTVRFCGLILQPNMPYWKMRWLAFQLGGWNTVYFNEQLDHFLIRPRSAGVIARHFLWRGKNLVRWQLRPGGGLYTLLWRLAHPWAFGRPLRYLLARAAGKLASLRKSAAPPPTIAPAVPPGVSVVIPSRNGQALLARLLPGLAAERPAEIIVSDNGSDDGTAAWLAREYPQVRVLVSDTPLSFARAVNRGIAEARYARLLMLNNDMVLEPGFLPPLEAAFGAVPDLFCATAQIFFPEGARREETGKAVMPAERPPEDFPVTCIDPIPGENLTYVLYGSGGCSMFDTAKLRALGGLDEIYEPAYVEDLDLGYRGWLRNWPTVFVAGARLEHRHQSTTSRYYSRAELDTILEINYLKFAARATATPEAFRTLWTGALERLNLRAARMEPDPAARNALAAAPRAIAWAKPQPAPAWDERLILAAGSGALAIFPGRSATARPRVLVASPYIPFPLAHGGAVRMFNLLTQGARDFDQILLCFVDELATPPAELLALCVEIVLVRRSGSHTLPLAARPTVVEEFDSDVFRAALRQTIRKWSAAIVQLEFTQLGLYAPDCAPAKTILVEHDVTLDLYAQLLVRHEDWETRQQYERWVPFERHAWRSVDAIVAMSEKDRALIGEPNAVAIPNGVDLHRFAVSTAEPEPARVLFIGSFAHLPNVMAVDFFLRQVWPLVRARCQARFHIIAGSRHQYFLERYRDRVAPPLAQPGVEVEDFVSDPRAAYRRACVVVAPLLASAGTNIKIMEAMAMGKAIVSTPAGVNGLDEPQSGKDLMVAATAEEMAAAIAALLEDRGRRHAIEAEARATAERHYGWEAIGEQQARLYRSLLATTA